MTQFKSLVILFALALAAGCSGSTSSTISCYQTVSGQVCVETQGISTEAQDVDGDGVADEFICADTDTDEGDEGDVENEDGDDLDNDGVADAEDSDDDNDGIDDGEDLDDDNDGISDDLDCDDYEDQDDNGIDDDEEEAP